LQYLRKFILY